MSCIIGVCLSRKLWVCRVFSWCFVAAKFLMCRMSLLPNFCECFVCACRGFAAKILWVCHVCVSCVCRKNSVSVLCVFVFLPPNFCKSVVCVYLLPCFAAKSLLPNFCECVVCACLSCVCHCVCVVFLVAKFLWVCHVNLFAAVFCRCVFTAKFLWVFRLRLPWFYR